MIYFVQAVEGGDIKIGTSRRLSQRLVSLRAAVSRNLRVLGVMDGGRAEEVTLHRQFSSLRTAGEWFRPEPVLLEFIRDFARDWDGRDSASAPNRIRVICEVSDSVRRVLAMQGGVRNMTLGEVVEHLVCQHLPFPLKLADDYLAKETSA